VHDFKGFRARPYGAAPRALISAARAIGAARVIGVAALALAATPLAFSAPVIGPSNIQAPEHTCASGLLRSIPARLAQAPSGRQFAHQVWNLSGPARDDRVLEQLLAGNVPSFLRHLVPVTLQGASTHARRTAVTVCVLPDYLAVGSDADHLYVPLGLRAALEVARRFGFLLPTPKLVDVIYAASPVKLDPRPLPPGDAMRSTAYVLRHTELIDLERALDSQRTGELTGGDKKDLVIDERLWRNPGRVAIYGWHRAAGRPIQPLSTVHGERYADYSHGVRLVSLTAYVNGAARRLEQILADPRLGPLLTRGGTLPHIDERLAALETAPEVESIRARAMP
jgi:hypothetical protein